MTNWNVQASFTGPTIKQGFLLGKRKKKSFHLKTRKSADDLSVGQGGLEVMDIIRVEMFHRAWGGGNVAVDWGNQQPKMDRRSQEAAWGWRHPRMTPSPGRHGEDEVGQVRWTWAGSWESGECTAQHRLAGQVVCCRGGADWGWAKAVGRAVTRS